MSLRILCFYLFLGWLLSTMACQSTSKDYIINGNKLEVSLISGKYDFTAVNSKIVKVAFSNDTITSDQNYAVQNTDNVKWKVVQKGPIIQASTPNLILDIDIENEVFSFHNLKNNSVLKTIDPILVNNDTLSYRFAMTENESIYGTGFRALPMNRRGHSFLSYNMPRYAYGWGEKTLNYNIPHILSSEKHMLLFDNPAKGWFDIGAKEDSVLEYKALAGNASYYYIAGETYSDLMEVYTELTGRQPLPPLWTFGNLQSRFGYRSREEMEGILETTLIANYPVEAVIIDLYWFGTELQDGKMGHLAWDESNWPEPKGMIEQLKEKGIKTVLVTEPFFTQKSQHFGELDQKDLLVKDSTGNTYTIPYFYFGEAGLLDIFNDDAKAWMWERYKELKTFGVDGWWVDLGEPEQHPSDMYHVNGKADYVHGIYGHEWAKMLTEGFRNEFPEERLFHLARGGFAGSQRYNIIPWSGDVGRNWSGLQPQPSIMLSMGLSGLAYMHSDAGGFTIDEKDEELYVRWMQMATFSPIFRPHADEIIPAEPALWPDTTQQKIKHLIEWRYRLLPYIYTMARENSVTGYPLTRPLFFEFEGVSDTIYNQYMWGKNIMVAPVLEKGIQEMEVYLPEGTWYDFFNGQQYQGDTTIIYTLRPDNIPVFYRGGTVTPIAQLVGNTEEYRTDTLDYRYYFAEGKSTDRVYFDDGKTFVSPSFKDYQMITIHSKADKDNLVIDIANEGNSSSNSYGNTFGNFEIIGLPSPVKKLVVNGINIDFQTTTTGSTTFSIQTNRRVIIEVVY